MSKSIINKMVVKVNDISSEGVDTIFSDYNQFIEKRFVPILSRVLEEYSTWNFVLERLAIDLTGVPEQEIEIAFEKKLRKLLKIRFVEPFSTENWSIDRESITGKAVDWAEVFISYLENGYFPWYATSFSDFAFFQHKTDQPDPAKLLDFLCENEPSKLALLLQTTITQRATERLLYLLESKYFLTFKVVRLLFVKKNAVSQWVISLSALLIETGDLNAHLRDYIFKRLVIAGLKPESKDEGLNHFVNRLEIRFVMKVNQNSSHSKWHFHYENIQSVPSPGEFLKLILNSRLQNSPKFEFDASRIHYQDIIVEESLSEIRDSDVETSLQVPNAGLILLSPFLHLFFEKCELLHSDGKWMNQQSKIKAIHLLHYLSFGDEICHEGLLVFNKILMGWPIQLAVPLNIKMSDQERTEATQLFEAVVGYWSVLGHTSVDGLRESFVRRNGRIGEQEHGYLLRVEPRSYDLLLESLPWSFSVVKFPWMRKTITTDWKTKI